MAGYDCTTPQTDAADRPHDMQAGTEFRIDHGQRALESPDYAEHGHKGEDLQAFRAEHPGEFTEVQSRPYASEKFADPDGVVRSINPHFEDPSRMYNVNCADCARGVERTWRGTHEEAAGRLPRLGDNGYLAEGEPSAETEEWAGETFTAAPDDAALRQALLEGGHGSSAIVHSSWGEGEQQYPGGHAFNLVNYQGEVRVLDGQIAGNLDWVPGDIHPGLGRDPAHKAMAWNARGERIW